MGVLTALVVVMMVVVRSMVRIRLTLLLLLRMIRVVLLVSRGGMWSRSWMRGGAVVGMPIETYMRVVSMPGVVSLSICSCELQPLSPSSGMLRFTPTTWLAALKHTKQEEAATQEPNRASPVPSRVRSRASIWIMRA